MKERSPFAKTFDRPLVRRAEWDAVIANRRAYDRQCRRFFGNPNGYPNSWVMDGGQPRAKERDDQRVQTGETA